MTGYEKLAGLMTEHTEVATFQRFEFLNTLNILYLQAELVHLEEELRHSIREDLGSGNNPISIPDEPSPLCDCRNGEEIEPPEIEQNSEAEGESHEMEKIPISQKGTPSASNSGSEFNERAVSARDWYFLANGDNSSTWDIMLKTREKLKEYSLPPSKETPRLISDNDIDEAVLRHKEMKRQDSPNECDLGFLQRWFKDTKMGNFPLVGKDSTLWESSKPSDLIAVRKRKAEDPLSTLFLSRAYLWWHNWIGHRMKKPVDEEALYFEYRDGNILRVANIVASILSSGILVASIVVLNYVQKTSVRLALVAVFTQVFSLFLILATSARKVEVFAATAAFVAVQVVFVGSTLPGTP